MSEKILKARLLMKNDTATNWAKATNFIPKKGEIIVYNVDSNYNYERMKIGDGITKVEELPFVSSTITNDEIDAICGASIYSAQEVLV